MLQFFAVKKLHQKHWEQVLVENVCHSKTPNGRFTVAVIIAFFGTGYTNKKYTSIIS